MIYITGDTHGQVDIQKINTTNFPDQRTMTDKDYLIVVGDFGICWDGGVQDAWLIDWYNSKPFTTLFIDGNHENFDLLYTYPTEEWNGGLVRKISNKIIYLERGQVFNIDDKTFFTMGGARSIDKVYRKEGVSWWKEEMPSQAEKQLGLDNLASVGYNVNYILTHAAPSDFVTNELRFEFIDADDAALARYLQIVKDNVTFDSWYLGHYHGDIDRSNLHLLYNRVIKLLD